MIKMFLIPGYTEIANKSTASREKYISACVHVDSMGNPLRHSQNPDVNLISIPKARDRFRNYKRSRLKGYTLLTFLLSLLIVVKIVVWMVQVFLKN